MKYDGAESFHLAYLLPFLVELLSTKNKQNLTQDFWVSSPGLFLIYCIIFLFIHEVVHICHQGIDKCL